MTWLTNTVPKLFFVTTFSTLIYFVAIVVLKSCWYIDRENYWQKPVTSPYYCEIWYSYQFVNLHGWGKLLIMDSCVVMNKELLTLCPLKYSDKYFLCSSVHLKSTHLPWNKFHVSPKPLYIVTSLVSNTSVSALFAFNWLHCHGATWPCRCKDIRMTQKHNQCYFYVMSLQKLGWNQA